MTLTVLLAMGGHVVAIQSPALVNICILGEGEFWKGRKHVSVFQYSSLPPQSILGPIIIH